MALSTGSKILVNDISTALAGKQDALGYTPVKSVNGTLADSAGNVIAGTVRSVNGVSADTAGNVAISISGGTVSQKANVASFTIAANSTVTKTVSNLTVNKPVYIVVAGTHSNVAGHFWVSSGTSMNATNGEYPTYFYNAISTWVCVIPTSTSIVLSFSPPSSSNKATSAKFMAYQ